MLLSVALHLALMLGLGSAWLTNGNVVKEHSPRIDDVVRLSLVRPDLATEPSTSVAAAASQEQAIAALPSGEIPAKPVAPVKKKEEELQPMLPLLQPAAPYYFQPAELTIKPAVVEDASTSLTLFVAGIETQFVILRLLINEAGSIDRVVIEESHFPADVEQKIVDTFVTLKFSPGKIDEEPVKSQLRIEVTLQGMLPSDAPMILNTEL
ncbi:MAG TPA: hypothetical protein DHV59_17990 [Oxalobacteraceae bacterium]|nr:hypothetical protein [Oxalobacteraceae bacterium]